MGLRGRHLAESENRNEIVKDVGCVRKIKVNFVPNVASVSEVVQCFNCSVFNKSKVDFSQMKISKIGSQCVKANSHTYGLHNYK